MSLRDLLESIEQQAGLKVRPEGRHRPGRLARPVRTLARVVPLARRARVVIDHVEDSPSDAPSCRRRPRLRAMPHRMPPLRDVQEAAASHADPRTTMRYDRARVSLDRHATYIVAAYLAGAAR
jgi:hypothetical protein